MELHRCAHLLLTNFPDPSTHQSPAEHRGSAGINLIGWHQLTVPRRRRFLVGIVWNDTLRNAVGHRRRRGHRSVRRRTERELIPDRLHGQALFVPSGRADGRHLPSTSAIFRELRCRFSARNFKFAAAISARMGAADSDEENIWQRQWERMEFGAELEQAGGDRERKDSQEVL